MTTLPTYCRITGHARNLPKPCYFPLLPPISPADARKICRITGRATDLHHYSPIIAFGKPYRFDGLEGCRITQHENLSFTKPIFITTKTNEKIIGLESLTQLFEKMKVKKKKNVDDTKLFVYKITDQSMAIIIPPELEEAIRTGEIENLSISKDVAHMIIKIKEGRLVKVQMETVDKTEIDEEKYYFGEGQSKEVLQEQQIILNERNKRKQETMARKKMFEKKEQKAEEEEKKATERPKSKKPLLKFDPEKRKEKLAKMGLLIQDNKNNTSIILPTFDPVSKVNPDEQIRYEQMLQDIANAMKVSVNVTTVLCTNFSFCDIQAEEAGFDWESFPKEDIYEPIEVELFNISSEELSSLANTITIDIAASVEAIEPAPFIEQRILNTLKNSKKENLKFTENVKESLQDMEALHMIPNMKDIKKIVEGQKSLVHGYLIKDKENKKFKFIESKNYVAGDETAISGAIILINNEEKFISGQIIQVGDEETFIAGQTFESPSGKQFVPGQTIIDSNGEVTFIPGCYLSAEEEEDNRFIAGRVISENNELKFVSGQMLDRGDKKPIFVPGQTIVTDDSLKFVPGEFITDEDEYKIFVPGIVMPCHGKEEFIPGQVFQTEDGILFTPGQVIDTDEGPTFVPGKIFKTSDGGKKFIKGEMLINNEGKMSFKTQQPEIKIPTIKEDLVETKDENVIPNDDLQLVAIVGKDISGFVVKPTNISNIQAGEKLYGDIVENLDSVLFYLSGKLPQNLSSDSKVISGKLTVDETSQRFIPGKMISSGDEEHFVPGQLVKTLHGQEFIPGQFVETADGPKFVPGHSVITSEGEKFIPGQVIVEEDGPRFVPGQIIQTKNGATFIPGQMMNTEKGKKFVPGQVIETKDGPRFVPGQVIETSEGPKFVSGTVVETEDGLKYLPTPSSVGINIEESEEDSEISFQGFDISPEEIRLLSHTIKTKPTSHAPITKEEGLIDSGMLKRLAADTMDIHGRTPEPNIKKKKKKGKITIDALDDDEVKTEVVKEDSGTTKVDVLKQLLKVGLTVSSFRKEKELEKLGDLLSKLENYNENEAEIEAMKFINSQTPQEDLCELYIGNDEQLIEEILHEIGDIDDIKRNDEVTQIVNDAIKKCVTKKCDEQISELIKKISKDPDSLFTDSAAQILLTEAVGVVCVTGDVEVASLLEKFISQPTNPNCLKDDKDVLAVLRQLLVLNRIAERKHEVAKVLQELQEDPEGIKDRNKVRKFIREAKSLLLSEKKSAVKQFDVRHVASSKDIPKEIFEQIKEDKEEAEKFMAKLPNELFSAIMGDERCGGNFLKSLGADKTGKATREMDKFRKGMAVVIAKDNVQAVIPRIYARSIYYGIMPYLLIDEEGYKFFEKGLTGRKLAPSRVIENTWYQPDSYYQKSVLAQQITPSGMQYNLVFLGDSYQRNLPSLQYTSLLPSSEPKKISYLESQRDGSVTPLRRSSRSTTPSRRFSLSSVHDYLPESYSRRNSSGVGITNLTRGVSPVDTSSIYSSNYSPYSGETSSSSLNRSGTIGKLLDKYSRTPLSKELGYQKPSIITSRYKSFDDEDEEPSNDLKGYGVSSATGSKYSSASDKSLENGLKDSYLDKDYNYSSKGTKTLQRPFSDIYETDELDSPTSEKSPIRSSLIETAKKNYDALNSNHRLTTPPAYRKESYTDRLRDWKSKQSKMDEDADEKPLKISHNRYESVLTGEDDDYDDASLKKKSPALKKSYNEDGDLDDDDDDFSIEKFRESLRQKYSQNIDNLSKSYKTPSPPKTSRFKKASIERDDDLEPYVPKTSRFKKASTERDDDLQAYLPKSSRFKKASIERDDDLDAYLPKSSRQKASEISKKYTGQEPDDSLKDTSNKWESSYGRENGLYSNGPMDNYTSPYNYNMDQNSYYGRQMGYDQPLPYSSPSMHGYQARYGGYGAGAPAYGYGGGRGMSMYTPNAPYAGAGTPRFGPSYGVPSSAYPAYSSMAGSAVRNMPYGGLSRRTTMPIHLSSDDDDDNVSPSDYKENKRKLALQLAKKYVADSDDEDE